MPGQRGRVKGTHAPPPVSRSVPTFARLVRRLLRLVAGVVREAVREAVRAELTALDAGPVPSQPRLLTLAEVAAVLGVSKRTAERLVCRGEIGTVRAGSARRVHPAALDAYVRSKAR